MRHSFLNLSFKQQKKIENTVNHTNKTRPFGEDTCLHSQNDNMLLLPY